MDISMEQHQAGNPLPLAIGTVVKVLVDPTSFASRRFVGKVGKISNLLDHGMASIKIAEQSNDLLWPISYLKKVEVCFPLGKQPLVDEQPLVEYKNIRDGLTFLVPNEINNIIFEFLFGLPRPVSRVKDTVSRVKETIDNLVLVAGLTGKTTFAPWLVSWLFPGKYRRIDFGRRLVALSEGSLSQNPDGSFRMSLGLSQNLDGALGIVFHQVRSFQVECSSWRDEFRHIFLIMATSSQEYEMMCDVLDLIMDGGFHSCTEGRYLNWKRGTKKHQFCRRMINRLKELGLLHPNSEVTFFGMSHGSCERAARVAP